MNRHRLLTTMLVLAGAITPRTLMACAVCMGGSDSPVAPAINAAIFTMLGVIGSMLAGIGGFAFYLHKRSQAPVPPHEELARAVSGL